MFALLLGALVLSACSGSSVSEVADLRDSLIQSGQEVLPALAADLRGELGPTAEVRDQTTPLDIPSGIHGNLTMKAVVEGSPLDDAELLDALAAQGFNERTHTQDGWAYATDKDGYKRSSDAHNEDPGNPYSIITLTSPRFELHGETVGEAKEAGLIGTTEEVSFGP